MAMRLMPSLRLVPGGAQAVANAAIRVSGRELCMLIHADKFTERDWKLDIVRQREGIITQLVLKPSDENCKAQRIQS